MGKYKPVCGNVIPHQPHLLTKSGSKVQRVCEGNPENRGWCGVLDTHDDHRWPGVKSGRRHECPGMK